MAGDWIKMRCDLDEDPAVIALASLIGLPEDHVIGKLWKLWRWANRQLRDGYAQGVTPEWVDRYLGVTGIAEALVKVGWLRVRTGGVEIPKFDLHNSQTAKERALTAKRVAHNRRSKCNGAPVTAPLPEKRREEKSKQDPPSPPLGGKEEDVSLPFSSPEFKAAWEEWLLYRRQRREKKYTPVGLRNLFAELSGWGEARAIASIRLSITKGWQGIHEAKVGAGPSANRIDDNFAKAKAERKEAQR